MIKEFDFDSIEKNLTHLNKEEIIKHFVSTEFNRFLSFYKDAPDLNIKKKLNKNERKIKGKAEKGYTRFFINIGKNQTLQTHNLIGLINERTKNIFFNWANINFLQFRL